MRVVIVDEELPFPTTSGKRIRSFNLAVRLAKRCQLTYLCYRNHVPGEADQAAAALRDHGIESVFVDRPAPGQSVLNSGLGLYARLGANLLNRNPYLVQIHNTPELRECIRNYARQNKVDLWQAEWTPYFESLDVVADTPRVVMAHNVESLIWQRYCETEKNPVKRWYIARQWHKFERFERDAFAKTTRLVTVSEEDARLAQTRFGAERVSVVENGVEISFFKPTDEPRQPKQVLFLGSLDWRPNLDAVNLLLDQIWPQVLTQEPDAKLVIVGRKPPQWLRDKMQGQKQVELHADAADVRPFIRSSGLMAVPLRIGGGSRLKILESLATGLPVVSTRVGAEGLRLTHNEHLVQVEAAEEMAPALVQAMRSPDAMRQMAARGRQVVLDEYNWDVLADKLEEVWRDCVSGSVGRGGEQQARTSRVPQPTS